MGLRIRALEKLQSFHDPAVPCPATVAGVESSVRLEGLRQPDHPRPIRSPLGYGTSIEDHPTVGQAAQVHAGAAPVFQPVSSPSGFAADAASQPSFLFVHGMNFKGTPDDAHKDLVVHWEEATGAFRPGGSGGCTDSTCQVYILVRGVE